ncbi:hypothetical protein ACIG87_16390 [Micromonospora sp. NPDC051925]|uniref:hypothetical protein n=1 Tax=Micromonospora sp. NPDC051925 TaxID=3364288 RepID=UPI0037CC9174
MRSSVLVLIKITVIVGLLTGCSATEPGSPTPPSPAVPAGTTSSATPTGASGTATPTGPAGDATAQGTNAAGSTGVDRVTLTRFGGFAGSRDTVTVEPDGRWTTTNRAGTSRTGRITTADLDRLRTLVGPATRSGDGGPPDGRCADTYIYQLTVGAHSVDWTDCPTGPQPPAAAKELATLLLRTTATG